MEPLRDKPPAAFRALLERSPRPSWHTVARYLRTAASRLSAASRVGRTVLDATKVLGRKYYARRPHTGCLQNAAALPLARLVLTA